MRIILTHEQADFDALASLLAAHLLDETALPVLPNRMNRNVNAFLTIYGAELPFLEQRDLPSGEAVESVCLVDTQSMITVRGITKNTRVHLIDHHPRRDDLPESWTTTIEETGATATQLVEMLQARNGHLSVVQATLLLLGIYEDTGSLTYSRTTPRDLQAAAFLLEQGASLRVASDFLNHPLSQAQQVIYDQLRQVADIRLIHGHSVIVASADARDVQEELSTIAHKLRDLLDPDALFLLLETRGGVQLIARSTNDAIDVAAVAARFGGGGHERAAAALIRERPLEEVRQELESSLEQHIRPAITVAQIMSGRPQLLSPDTLAAQALERMQRYGYEGYPVVKQGKVIGLLTRRAVDRAVSHRLNLTASSLMSAGEVTVHPQDSLERLQRMMTESGWGQIPVVNPQSGEIIGIVTRTDLLKVLAPQPRREKVQKQAELLAQVLPPARLSLLHTVADAAYAQHMAVYVVGGFVRDLLLERPSLDFDIVVEGDAIALARALSKQYGGRITSHTRFGTAKWYLPKDLPASLTPRLPAAASPLTGGEGSNLPSSPHKGEGSDQLPSPYGGGVGGEGADDYPDFIDLISARTEFYSEPTALPTVEHGSIKLDLHRRDFTINTLALRLDGTHFGELHDYWGGLNDLRHGLVRVLHSLSFVDDPTRMLRAVRYEQRYGFKIEPRTLSLLGEALPLLGKVTGERLHAELEHILDEEQAVAMLTRLESLGLLRLIYPGLEWRAEMGELLQALPQEPPSAEWGLPLLAHGGWTALRRALSFALWLMKQAPGVAAGLLERVNYPRHDRQMILAALKLHQQLDELVKSSRFTLVETLDEYPPLAVYTAWLAAGDLAAKAALEGYLKEWRKVHPLITGDDLRRIGLPPSPQYKRILGALRKAWLEGQVSNAAEEQALLAELLRAQPGR